LAAFVSGEKDGRSKSGLAVIAADAKDRCLLQPGRVRDAVTHWQAVTAGRLMVPLVHA